MLCVALALCSPNGVYKGTVKGHREGFGCWFFGGVSGDIEAVVDVIL